MDSQKESTPKSLKTRSKSMVNLHYNRLESLTSSLEQYHNENGNRLPSSFSESLIDVCFDYNSKESSYSGSKDQSKLEDSGIGDKSCHSDELVILEQKIDKLGDIFVEQNESLSELQVEIQQTNEGIVDAVAQQCQAAMRSITNNITERLVDLHKQLLEDTLNLSQEASGTANTNAKALLESLRVKNKDNIDDLITSCLLELLQTEDLKEDMVTKTVQSIKAVIVDSMAEEMSSSYIPILENSHKLLLKHVTVTLDNAFKDIREHTSSFSRYSYKASRYIKTSLERHQRLMHSFNIRMKREIMVTVTDTVGRVMEQELRDWKEKFIKTETVVHAEPLFEFEHGPVETHLPDSPPQPLEPGKSAIDQLMTAADINVRIREGDLNGSFERALSASDLSLVMATCRAADPRRVFDPCTLSQRVLLSLAQQLATDLVCDTQLKCRYLEDTIMNLDPHHPVTRKHLPLVIGEVKSNLTIFITKYPKHMASRRINLMIMAAGGLLEGCIPLCEIKHVDE